MIKLQIEDYCQNCSEFEPHVEKVDISSSDLYSYEKIECTDTTVTCKHRQRCDCIKKYLEKQSSKLEKAQSMETSCLTCQHCEKHLTPRLDRSAYETKYKCPINKDDYIYKPESFVCSSYVRYGSKKDI